MIYVGCSGWSYDDWKDVFYPKGLSPQRFLSLYAAHFSTVEVNNTFYRFPSDKTIHTWLKQVPNNFKFSLKVSRYVTHIKRMNGIKDSLKGVYSLQNKLQDKMGCFLFQFPETYRYTQENLERILSQLDPAYKNVLEFRHESWWDPDVIQALQTANFIFCTVSGFRVPDDLVITKGVAYIRFHGDPGYATCYTDQDLIHWSEKIKDKPIKELWAYFNNNVNAHAVQNAKFLKNLV